MHKANFFEVAPHFNGVIFDIYGVVWNGSDFYPNALESLAALKRQGKVIGLLSNGTQLRHAAQKKYEGKGLLYGVHYDFLLTSGEVARTMLLERSLTQITIPGEGAKCCVIGNNNEAMFAGTGITIVQNPDEADFAYIGVLQVNGKSCVDATPFMEQLRVCCARGLKIFCANPDYYAQEASGYVACQGLVAKEYEDMGGVVEWCGKPYARVFEVCFEEFRSRGVVDKSQMCIVGDTLRTDVLGGFKVGIQTVLVTTTGVAADAVAKGESLEQQMRVAGVRPDFTIDQVAGTLAHIAR